MYANEKSPSPSGRFPSVETEASMRSDFLYIVNNPLHDYLVSKIEYLGIDDPNGYIAMNFLAFNYGLYFFNLVSNYSLYPEGEYPKFEISTIEGFPTVFVTPYSDDTYINALGSDFEYDFNRDPIENLQLVEEPEIEFPTFITHILGGIEEASHLLLQKEQFEHGANSNSQDDNDNPDMWKAEVASSIEYRSQKWHEFAAITVQRMFIQYYLSGEYPAKAAEFESYYQQVKNVRRQRYASQ